MKKLHTFDLGDNVQVELLKSLLARNGIACTVRGENMFSAAGGVPFTECYPELWIHDDDALGRAQSVLEAFLAPADVSAAWTCSVCSEAVEGQFGACWNCEAQRND